MLFQIFGLDWNLASCSLFSWRLVPAPYHEIVELLVLHVLRESRVFVERHAQVLDHLAAVFVHVSEVGVGDELPPLLESDDALLEGLVDAVSPLFLGRLPLAFNLANIGGGLPLIVALFGFDRLEQILLKIVVILILVIAALEFIQEAVEVFERHFDLGLGQEVTSPCKWPRALTDCCLK
jgi:hypothetical protein